MGGLAQLKGEPATVEKIAWPPALRLAFRFAFSYFILYAAPENGRVSPLYWIPGVSKILQLYIRGWHAFIPWIAVHGFHLSGRGVTYFPTGSGDTTLSYIENFVFLASALVSALIWTALDRRRKEYGTLHECLRILIRYTLALTMFSYGFAKVFPMQFQPTGFRKLVEPYGEFSPMGVLWSFMGASMPYTIFAGFAEVLGGALLLFRRTTALGALWSAAVLANVVALNFCYDVPVKLYSTNLLIMALFLLVPDLRRLLNVLVLNRSAAPAALSPVRIRGRQLRYAALAVKPLFLAYVAYTQLWGGWSAYRETRSTANRAPLYGLYEVEKFQLKSYEVQPLASEGTRWRYVGFEYPGSMWVRQMDGSFKAYPASFEKGRNVVDLGIGKDPFTYAHPDAGRVSMDGLLSGERLVLTLRKVDPSQFPLVSRGFHWISEMPFNR